MHNLLEIILPPVDEADLKDAIGSILAPFYVGDELNTHPFWDWWVIGGRWAGNKQEALLGTENIANFRAELERRNVTVSGLQAGKQELSPASQISMVDGLWKEWFPESRLEHCPLFAHSNDQYKEHLPGDVMPLSMLPNDYTAGKVIVAVPERDWSSDDAPIAPGKFKAKTMLEKEYWNGVSLVRTDWSGMVSDALAEHAERVKHAVDSYREMMIPRDNWLAVTVDYHS